MLKIKQIRKKDFNTARKFALEGMHFDQYTGNKLELYVYSKYFWYLEISRATTALGAYDGDRLVGVLLADMKNKPKLFKSLWYKAYIKFVTFMMKSVYNDAATPYDQANEEMLKVFLADAKADGELICFAAAPNSTGKGIGTFLLQEFEKQEKGKTIYLFTDSKCTYQFYLHRGFRQIETKDICLSLNNKRVSLTCFLFAKVL